MNILWDFDGTLFNTYPAYTNIFYEVLEQQRPTEEILQQLKISFTHAVKYFNLTEFQIEEIFRREESLQPEQTPPFPDLENILRTAEKNVIMTHKPRREVIQILQHYHWESYFVDIVAGDDGFPRKPDPASYLHLHHRNRIDFIIGDREIDILPGKALGIKTCLFQNETPGADFYLTNYRDFFNVIPLEK
ncbi:HAD-IA family hydrolase [Paenibacillus cellulositrophicus]|uniref:HAD-IA family hydrolase n=1 Tax=Paenibacillus cellulositrophicus TaxID=562959 RepID=UPI0012670A1C|nr:HAD-IA family hydrolase [Paenibacillus cellulositrophicus]